MLISNFEANMYLCAKGWFVKGLLYLANLLSWRAYLDVVKNFSSKIFYKMVDASAGWMCFKSILDELGKLIVCFEDALNPNP